MYVYLYLFSINLYAFRLYLNKYFTSFYIQNSVQWFLPIILWAATTESFKFDIFNIFNKPSHTGSSASTQKQQTSSSSSAPTSNLTISNATVPVSTPHQSAAVHNSTEKQQTPTNILPYLPDVQNLSELDGRTASQKYLPNNLTPYQEAQLKLSNYTATDLACYIAPPSNQIIDMKKVSRFFINFTT